MKTTFYTMREDIEEKTEKLLDAAMPLKLATTSYERINNVKKIIKDHDKAIKAAAFLDLYLMN